MKPKELKNWISNKYKILKKTIRKPNFWIITLLAIIALSLIRPIIYVSSESWYEDKDCVRQIENPEITKYWSEYTKECMKPSTTSAYKDMRQRIEDRENCERQLKSKKSQEKNIPEYIDEKYNCPQRMGTKRITKLILFSANRPIYLTIFVRNIRK